MLKDVLAELRVWRAAFGKGAVEDEDGADARMAELERTLTATDAADVDDVGAQLEWLCELSTMGEAGTIEPAFVARVMDGIRRHGVMKPALGRCLDLLGAWPGPGPGSAAGRP